MTAIPTPQYQSPCGWNALLPERAGQTVSQDLTCDLAVVGAGYTGLAAARRWAEAAPDDQVVVLDALSLGEGNPGRNSGFLLEVALAEDADESAVTRLSRCNALIGETMAEIARLVAASAVPCELVRHGTYRAAVGPAGRKSLAGYRKFLDAAGLPYAALDGAALASRIGTRFYTEGLYSPDCYLAQPAALIRALADTLPDSVTLFERSEVSRLERAVDRPVTDKAGWVLTSNGCRVQARQVILANNAFAKQLDSGASRVVAMFTSAGLTQPLGENDLSRLGGDEVWGLLPAHRMGATLRRTSDGRLLARTFHGYEQEADPLVLEAGLRDCLRRRFPDVEIPPFVSVWSGATGYTQGGGPLWGRLGEGLWASAGCNGGGVVKGTLFGRALAESALGLPGVDVPSLFGAAGWLPPDPFRRLGYEVAARWGEVMGAAERRGLESGSNHV